MEEKNVDEAPLTHLPPELVAGVLIAATPKASILASTALLAHVARDDPVLPLAWSHAILAASDASIMDVVPGEWWSSPAIMDSSEYPDTRGLPTPATWLMKRHIRALLDREGKILERLELPADDLKLGPSPFAVPAVVDYLLRPHRFQSIADTPLDEVVRAWDAPCVAVADEWISWKFDTPAPLATQMAKPRLRPFPEALQLAGLFLLTSELERFKDLTRRLAALLPTLTTAKAPVALWMRLGIDDRSSTRQSLSVARAGDDGWGAELLTEEITLPTHWAVMAAAEGRVDVLDHLVAELGVDPQALTAFLSFQMPTSFFMQSLIQLSTLRRVVPTWEWLLAHGYVYPLHVSGPLSMAVATAAEYATVRTFFLEYDKPRILAVTDIDDRVSQFHFLVNALWGWTSKGHYDLLPVFAELRILTPRNTFPYLARGPAGANLLPMIESLCPLIDGGLPGLIDYGMECHASDVRCAIKLAYDLWPESFADIIAKHYERPGFISTLVSVKGVQDKVDHKVLAMRVIQQFGAKGGNEVTAEEAGVTAIQKVRTNGLGKLMLRVLCDPGDCGASAWAAIDSLAPVQRIRMFGLFAREMPGLEYLDATQEPAPTLAVGLAPVGWPTWQYVLDRMLPPTMDARTGSGPVRDLIVRGTRAWLSARRSSSTADSNKKVDDPWSADLRTASAVAALPIDPGRHSEQLPLWVAARVCILAPDVVLPIVSFTAHTPTWLWQMRLDVIKNVTPAPEGWQPARLKNWVGIVATAMANERPETAKLVMEIAHEEQRAHGEPSVDYMHQIRGMSKKWPVVVDLAHEAGYMDV